MILLYKGDDPVPFALRIIAFFMCLILPVSNFIGSFSGESDAVYTDYEKHEKAERKMTEFIFGKNDICVSPAGSDSADGSAASPLRTVAAAKALASQKRKDGVSGTITVWIKGGEYLIDSPLEFTRDDENTSYIAYPGESVKLTGAVKVSGWQAGSINGRSALSAEIPDGVSFVNLIKNGKTVPQTRYPESGYFHVKETNHEGGLFTDENTPWDWSYGDLELTPDNKQEIKEFANPGSVTLRVLHYWADEISTLKGYDGKRNRILFTKPCSMKIEKDQKYYYENVREALDKEGEWYLDTAEGKLWYIPLPGESADNLDISYAVTEKLINADGCGNLTFEGITFQNTDSVIPEPEKGSWLSEYGMRFPQAEYDCGGALEFRNCENINIRYCRFENIGLCAVKFNRYVKNSSVTGCDFINTGATGIFINGDNTADDSLATQGITVRDNLIDGYGRYFYSAIGVFITHAKNCVIENNEICNGYYTAVSVGWLWGYAFSVTQNIKIRNNLIYNIGQGWLSDMGGIYTLGSQPGTEITGNVIHNVAADTGEGGYGGWGIYLDEGSQHINVYKNLVYACGSQSFHQHYGENNMIKNNIFALSEKGEVQSSFYHRENQTGYKDEASHNEFTLEKNIILTRGTPAYTEIGARVYTDKGNIYWDLKNRSNIYCDWNSANDPLARVFAPQMKDLGLFNDAVIENPQFRDPENFDFTLPDNSPLLQKTGFEKWNYNAAGTLTEHTAG
ncbi:MAG: right-handed parallel beta-helix repeat-containing protein [Clostridia bacterium]|nr:right-handed parallel beta-helix repeat-containing protein [Clostridia bacterium]